MDRRIGKGRHRSVTGTNVLRAAPGLPRDVCSVSSVAPDPCVAEEIHALASLD
jgi:hypothetical protein